MATLQNRRSQNIEGEFYVDSTCIDCDTCRWLSPEIFNRQDSQSAVHHQPKTPAEEKAGLRALLACPTASIGTVNSPNDIKAIQAEFPLNIAENVYYCGYHSKKSFGATSYFIQRPDGNILIDSPRFNPPLTKQLEKMGGVKYLYLTHRDDVADHQKFHDYFGCDRLLHETELREGTKNIEIVLTGTEDIDFAEDIKIIAVPGHTEGHTVLLYKNKYLFTGDHLAYSVRLGHLTGFRNFCWYSWEQQTESMKKLRDHSFSWILPGHGRRYHRDSEAMQKDLQQCIDWMASV
ncbi:metallo-beta-lactamase superfamily hydrolase [[Leptolyngbya] sp. PCC 7376]|uniref:MBL fold metallo-hydrolase n=1 Tax=[Leptolyngbya] sp. PCC 7376 TaxID=111781 RepID=UPI00029F00EF|nr:MBL fold metallo-hydrolase [[Leptolyngbya] sp. PCC 7376]AFY40074.1 metallo-beta-lactamase superfamily hydrolase [[Leptolyngbya] sp. PCC 7376]